MDHCHVQPYPRSSQSTTTSFYNPGTFYDQDSRSNVIVEQNHAGLWQNSCSDELQERLLNLHLSCLENHPSSTRMNGTAEQNVLPDYNYASGSNSAHIQGFSSTRFLQSNTMPEFSDSSRSTLPGGSPAGPDNCALSSLFPDDEAELFAGMVEEFDRRSRNLSSSGGEEVDDADIFSSSGGMELEGESGESQSRNGAQQQSRSSLTGEHPLGEHPSRTLFVRNINSNVEDTELRSLFQQYGDIRTLYTACKHRGFVMISYYDIRAAKDAMRALHSKPLRRRKLDIHFSIPKENPSDKDVNQGTLVVFNLDSSVSNEELKQIFGAYGEVKEIRETPNKRHHKFIEFFDVRAAEAALKALNRSDIAGKKIKLEPSRPGGSRRSANSQQGQEMEQMDPTPMYSSHGSAADLMSYTTDVSSLQSIRQAHLFPNGHSHGSGTDLSGMAGPDPAPHSLRSFGGQGSNLPPYPLLSMARAASSSSIAGLSNLHDPLGHIALSSQLPGQQSASVPVSDLMSGIMGMRLGRGLESTDLPMSRASSVSTLSSMSAIQLPNYFGSQSLGSPRFPIPDQGSNPIWGSTSSSPFFQSTAAQASSSASPWTVGTQDRLYTHQDRTMQDSLLESSVYAAQRSQTVDRYATSFEPSYTGSVSQSLARGNGLGTLGLNPQSRGHLNPWVNRRGLLPPQHHVGSDSLLMDRHYSLLAESEGGIASTGSLGSIGNDDILLHSSSSNLGLLQQYCSQELSLERNLENLRLGSAMAADGGLDAGLSLLGGVRGRNLSPLGLLSGSQSEAQLDRAKSRQREQGAGGAVDSKKQYQLDLEKILLGDDKRTTLMIRNIPNKYTQKMLLAAIDENHKWTYDFFYLPIDFKNKCNVGYAFINMVDPLKIIPLFHAFNGKKWDKFNSEKVAVLAYARIQGKSNLVTHFQNSSLMNEDKRCRPILFHSNGDQEPFPIGVNVRPRQSRERAGSGVGPSSHQGSPSTSSGSRGDDSNHGANFFGSGSSNSATGYL